MQTKKPNLFVMLTVIVVALSIPISLLVLRGDLNFKFSAFLSDIPEDVVITDVTTDSFRVTWLTGEEVTGGVVIKNATLPPFLEEAETSFHSVEVTGLSPGSSYEFVLTSNGTEYMQDGANYLVKTASQQSIVQSNFLVFGQVFATDGLTTQNGGTISLALYKDDIVSQSKSAIINETGGYQIDLQGMLDQQLSRTFPYLSELDIELTVYTLDSDLPVTKKFTWDLSKSRQIPNIYLGEVSVDVIPGVDGTAVN